VRIAHENPGWGYTRIQGALLNLDIKIGRGTIRRILKEHLIEPAPARGRRVPWSVFLKAHWKVIAASDFFTVEVWSWRGPGHTLRPLRDRSCHTTRIHWWNYDESERDVDVAGREDCDGWRIRNAPRQAAHMSRASPSNCHENTYRIPLRREGKRYALATQCIGGGQGIATISGLTERERSSSGSA
jgi:hypothetical protein